VWSFVIRVTSLGLLATQLFPQNQANPITASGKVSPMATAIGKSADPAW
jgi:hypothetical protein